MTRVAKSRIQKKVKQAQPRLLLIGDSILDEYVYGEEVCTALDAPVPEAEHTKSAITLGGAGLVAANILELGGRLQFFTLIGADEAAAFYHQLEHSELEKFFVTDSTRKTTLKSRWYIDGKKLLQLNKVDNHYISPQLQKRLLSQVSELIHAVDAVVISDPQHGMLPKPFVQGLIASAHAAGKEVYADTQISHRPGNFSFYAGADYLFLNEKEARAALPSFDARRGVHGLEELKDALYVKNVIVKLGARGSMALVNGRYYRIPVYRVAVKDPCGAGDAFLAAFATHRHLSPAKALRAANTWAALSTTVHGTLPPKRTLLQKALRTAL